MDFMTGTPLGPSPFLFPFKNHQGKMIMYDSVNDGIFSAVDLVEYYSLLDLVMGGRAQDFARLFMIPNMAHCGAVRRPTALMQISWERSPRGLKQGVRQTKSLPRTPIPPHHFLAARRLIPVSRRTFPPEEHARFAHSRSKLATRAPAPRMTRPIRLCQAAVKHANEPHNAKESPCFLRTRTFFRKQKITVVTNPGWFVQPTKT